MKPIIRIELTDKENLEKHDPVGLASVQPLTTSTITQFNYKYICQRKAFDGVSYTIANKTFLDNTSLSFSNPSEFFVSMLKFPFNLCRLFRLPEDPGETDIKMMVGGVVVKAPTSSGEEECYGFKMPNSNPIYPVGSFKLHRIYDNFLDYQVQILLYIPYCDSIILNPKDIYEKQIWLYLGVDTDSGNCTGYVQSVNDDGTETLIATSTGQCGMPIPIGKTNLNELTRNFVTSTLASSVGGLAAMGIGAATGNPLLVGMGVAGGISGVAKAGWNAMDHHISLIGNSNGNQFFANPQIPFIKIVYPDMQDETYIDFKGKPLMRKFKLGNLTGFTKVDSIHLEGFETATSNELDELDALLKEGFII